MAMFPRVREQHIAVFGESGSGKTVLLSSFYGPTQEKGYSNGLWDLVADDAGQQSRLYQNYLGMRDHATVPLANHFAATTYYFSVRLKSGDATTTAEEIQNTVNEMLGEWCRH